MDPLIYVNSVPIFEASELPQPSLPKKVICSATHVIIDDSIVIEQPIGTEALEWLFACLNRWADEDPSRENGEQLLGILEACQQRYEESCGFDIPQR